VGVSEAGKEIQAATEATEQNKKESESYVKATKEWVNVVMNQIPQQMRSVPGEQEKYNAQLKYYLNQLATTNKSQKEIFESGEIGSVVANAIRETTAETVTTLAKKKELDGRQSQLVKEIDVLTVLSTDSAQETLRGLDEQVKTMEDIAAKQSMMADRIALVGRATDDAVTNAKRELELVSIRAGVDTAMGRGIENHVASIEQQVKTYQEQLRVSEEARAKLDKYVKDQDKLIADDEQLIETKKANKADAEEIKLVESRIAGNIALQNKAKEANKTAESAEKSLFDTMIRSVDNFQDTMTRLSETPEFRRVTAEVDLSGAMQEAANFSDDWQNIMRQSVALAAEASKERLEIEKDGIEKAYKAKKAAKDAEIELAGAASHATPEEIARNKAEIGRTLEANKQLEISKKETAQKKSALEAVKAAAALATEMVDMQQQVTDAESQFLTEVGGNWQTILDLQQQSVQFEKQKADIAAKMAADVYASGNRGKEFAQAQTAAKLAELKYQQKALGAQKSAYEGILGMAFGAIRDSVGARKGMNSAVMILGREASRLKTRSGMFRGAGGKIMTIDERSALSQLGAVGGGPGGGPGGPASDLPPAVQDILKKSPRKLETDAINEAQLAEAEKTRKLDEKMSGDIGIFTKKATTDKSLYTADTVTQDWLSKICDYAGQTVQAIAGLGEAGGIGATHRHADSKGTDVLTDLYDYLAGSAAGRGIRKIVKNLFVNQKDASETANKNAKEGGGTLESIDENVAKGSEAQREAAKVAAEVAKATAKRVSEMTSPTAGNKEDLKYINKTGFQSFAGKKAPGGKGGKGGKGDVKQFPDWEEYRYEVAAEVAKGLDEAFAKEQAEAKKAKEYALKRFAPKKKAGPYATPKEVAAGKEADANRLAAGKKTAKGIADKDGEQDLRVQEDIRRFLKDAADSLERGETPGSLYVHDVSVERALKFKQDAEGKSADFNRKSLEKQGKFNKDFEAKRAKFDSSFASAAKGSDDSGRSDAQKKMFPDWEKEVISRGIGVGKDLDKQFAADKNKAENAEYKDWKSIQDKYASKGGGEAKQISDLNQGISDAIARQTEEQKQFADPVKGSAFMRQSGGLETAPGQAAPGAAGEAVAGADSATVSGEVKVTFDNKMFRTAVAQIVGEVIRTGETRKVLTRQGFTNEVV